MFRRTKEFVVRETTGRRILAQARRNIADNARRRSQADIERPTLGLLAKHAVFRTRLLLYIDTEKESP